MAESHSTATHEATKASSTAQPPVQDINRTGERESDHSDVIGDRVMRAVGGGSPQTPPSKFAGALGQLGGAAQRGMLRKLQRSYGNSYVGTVIQAKLTVGQPGDKYEEEADRVAATVVNQINTPGLGNLSQPQSVQTRLQENSEFQQRIFRQAVDASVPNVQADFETALNRAKGGGSPLDNAFRAKVEPAMGADFSGVRVHTDAEADRLSQSIQAKAFTMGQDIFFKKGEYDPGSQQGQELLAHELTHVVQQTNKGNQIQLIQLTPQEDFFDDLRLEGPTRPLIERLNRVIDSLEPDDLPEAEGLLLRLQNPTDELGQYFRERLPVPAQQERILERLNTAIEYLRQGLPANTRVVEEGESAEEPTDFPVGSDASFYNGIFRDILQDWHRAALTGAGRLKNQIIRDLASDNWSGFIIDLVGNIVWAAAVFVALANPATVTVGIATATFAVSMAGIAINMSDDVPTEVDEDQILHLLEAYINLYYNHVLIPQSREYAVRYAEEHDSSPGELQVQRDFMQACSFPPNIQDEDTGTVSQEATANFYYQRGQERLERFREQVVPIHEVEGGEDETSRTTLVWIRSDSDSELRLALVRETFGVTHSHTLFLRYITRDVATAAIARWRGGGRGRRVPRIVNQESISGARGVTPSADVATASIGDIGVREELAVPEGLTVEQYFRLRRLGVHLDMIASGGGERQTRIEERIIGDYPSPVRQFIEQVTWNTMQLYEIPIFSRWYANMGGEEMQMHLADLTQTADGQHQWRLNDHPSRRTMFRTLLPPQSLSMAESEEEHISHIQTVFSAILRDSQIVQDFRIS